MLLTADKEYLSCGYTEPIVLENEAETACQQSWCSSNVFYVYKRDWMGLSGMMFYFFPLKGS